jgi:acetyl-CoA C-acetyltransferase
MAKEVFIIAAARTPIGAFLGGLSTIPATTFRSYSNQRCFGKKRK